MYNPNSNIYIPTSTMICRIALLLIMFAFLSACSGGGDGVKITTYPKISLSVSNTFVVEGSGATVTLTVRASKKSDKDITVSLLISGSATKNEDYSIVNDLTLTIPAGSTTATTEFIIDDSDYPIDEGEEIVKIFISNASNV